MMTILFECQIYFVCDSWSFTDLLYCLELIFSFYCLQVSTVLLYSMILMKIGKVIIPLLISLNAHIRRTACHIVLVKYVLCSVFMFSKSKIAYLFDLCIVFTDDDVQNFPRKVPLRFVQNFYEEKVFC